MPGIEARFGHHTSELWSNGRDVWVEEPRRPAESAGAGGGPGDGAGGGGSDGGNRVLATADPAPPDSPPLDFGDGMLDADPL